MSAPPIRAAYPMRGVASETEAAACATGSRPRSLLAVTILALVAGALTPGVGQAARAPVLRAHGKSLTWTRAGRRNAYQLLIRDRGKSKLVTVTGRRVTPPADPGARVIYRVRAAFHESAWSNTVAISYPARAVRERPAEHPQGAVKYRLDASSYFDRFAQPQFAPWVRAHVSLINGYPPFSNKFVSLFGLPLIGYHDPATEGQAPLGPAGIEAYVGKVTRDVRRGYAGVFIDDANWSAGYTPSPGPRANLANLIDAIRAAEPSARIEINSHFPDIWPLMRSGDPDVARALRSVSAICVEFGVGPTSGIDTANKYDEFMEYAAALHAKGIALSLTGDRFNNNVPTIEYNLATYFLLNEGGDYASGPHQSPTSWWSGFDVDLGTALAGRERLPSGVWTRRFTRGVVYTVEPRAGTRTINLKSTMHSAEWGDVRSLTLSGGQGAVLVG